MPSEAYIPKNLLKSFPWVSEIATFCWRQYTLPVADCKRFQERVKQKLSVDNRRLKMSIVKDLKGVHYKNDKTDERIWLLLRHIMLK